MQYVYVAEKWITDPGYWTLGEIHKDKRSLRVYIKSLEAAGWKMRWLKKPVHTY